jgi:bifunctional non-homologous end joining protein LigD
VLYAFDLLMLRGRDVRYWPLDERRHELLETVKNLSDGVRYSETFNVPLADLECAVREHRLEGIVAKRAGSPYRSGERSSEWLKWRANRGQEFVVGGYIPNGNALESILVGYYERCQLIYAANVVPDFPASSGVRCCHTLKRFRLPAVHLAIYRTAPKVAGVKALRLPG